jgi:ubiquinone/menaquinone biosynthesis C-methylase UbiE
VDLGYTEPRLVALYDEDNAGTWDTDFYASLIGSQPQRVADVGCGTGSFAVRLAQADHSVVGVDPAAEMLRFARFRPGGELVQWVEGDATNLPHEPFNAAVMTGHAFQCLLTDEEILGTLVAVKKRLLPGGRFMFESRNPARKAWLGWTSGPSQKQTSMDSIETTRKVVDRERELVTFEETIRFESDGATFTSRSTLRFVPSSHLAGLLGKAGYRIVRWFGGWNGDAFDPGKSPEIIVVAE